MSDVPVNRRWAQLQGVPTKCACAVVEVMHGKIEVVPLSDILKPENTYVKHDPHGMGVTIEPSESSGKYALHNYRIVRGEVILKAGNVTEQDQFRDDVGTLVQRLVAESTNRPVTLDYVQEQLQLLGYGVEREMLK